MDKFTCIIADDEPLARQLVGSYVEQIPFLNLVGTCKNAWEVKEELQKQAVDLLLLDIQMPGLDGLTFIKTLPNPPKVIFITAHRDYAVEAFEVKALDYLMKPVTFERFIKAVNNIQQAKPEAASSVESGNSMTDHLFVNANRQMQRIDFQDILYIEAQGDYAKFHLETAKPILSKVTLKELSASLTADFVQIHRSFIVHKEKIKAYTNERVQVGETWLTISRSFKEHFKL